MHYLIELKTKKVIFKNAAQTRIGAQWDDHPELYKWFEGADDFVRPIFDGANVVEGKTLEEFKQDAYAAINAKTTQIILRGFQYGDDVFSTSEHAQINCQTILFLLQNDMIADTGLPFNTISDSKIVIIRKNEMVGFCTALLQSVIIKRSAGTILKQKVRDMKTIEDVKKFKDIRDLNPKEKVDFVTIK